MDTNTLMKKNLSQNDYRSKAEYLSASDVKLILENPYLYKIGYKKPQSDNMLLGSLIHCLIIEPEKLERDFYLLEKIDARTTQGKLLKEKAMEEAQGKMIISHSLLENAKAVADSFLKSEVSNLFKNGVGEQSFFGEIDGIKCKCRPDYYIETKGKKIIVDLKTTRFGGANADNFSKTIANFGYYIQASFYKTLLEADEFVFVAVETEAPYMIGVFELDIVSLEFGLNEIKRAFEIYKNLDKVKNVYLDTNDYKKKQILTLPNYVFYKNGAKM